jgi:hypothetical protein
MKTKMILIATAFALSSCAPASASEKESSQNEDPRMGSIETLHETCKSWSEVGKEIMFDRQTLGLSQSMYTGMFIEGYNGDDIGYEITVSIIEAAWNVPLLGRAVSVSEEFGNIAYAECMKSRHDG